MLAACLFATTFGVHAHGGVAMEEDHCVMRIGAYRAHFTGYQPETRASQEFCEDIPQIGRAVFVIDFVDAGLRDRAVEFRLLRDDHRLGRRARYEDLGDAAAIEAATRFRLAPQVYGNGALSFEQVFEAPGAFIGLLSTTDAQGHALHSVFPFEVGVSHPWRYVPPMLLVVGLSLLIWRLTGRNLPSPTPGKSDA